jgi:hypothetical protein
MISSESVNQACAEVGEYTDEQLSLEFERFFREQPSICDFVVELTQESDPKIQELSLFLSYMIFKAVEIGEAGTITAITSEAIESAYRESEFWIERISQTEGQEIQGAVAESLQRDTEPYLLRYVISEISGPLEDGTELDDEEKGEVFFVLKTVISSFGSRTV